MRILAIVGLVLLLMLAGWLYFFTNLLPLGAADPGAWQHDAGFNTLGDARYRWTIIYESASESQFRGTVRHVTPDRMPILPLLSHDVLVTSGDFADPAKVDGSVNILLHRFSWHALGAAAPQGSINLLHTVPASRAILAQLYQLRYGDVVLVSGREILRIEIYDLQAGQSLGYWQDDGCNTLLVTGVQVLR